MAKLYAEQSIVIAIEAGRTAGELAIKKTFDVHFRDAALKCGLEANSLISGHEDEIDESKIPKGALPQDDQMAGEEILRQCDEIERQLPKGGAVDQAALDPALIMMVLQVFSQLMDMWNRRKSQPS